MDCEIKKELTESSENWSLGVNEGENKKSFEIKTSKSEA